MLLLVSVELGYLSVTAPGADDYCAIHTVKESGSDIPNASTPSFLVLKIQELFHPFIPSCYWILLQTDRTLAYSLYEDMF